MTLFLAECGVPVAERGGLLDLVDGDRHGCWVRPHGDRLPEAAPGVLFQHQTASTIICYHPSEIPVILQSGEYANEDLLYRFGSDDEVVRHEFVRGHYHSILSDDTSRDVVCFLHETVLRSVPLDNSTRWSLYYDLTCIIESKRAEVRIIPADREAALRVPVFSLLRTPGRPPLVCRPCETVTLILEGDHTNAYEPSVALLDDLALSNLESRDLIVEIAGGQEAIATPPAEIVEELAQDGETWEPWFITEAITAVQEAKDSAEQSD